MDKVKVKEEALREACCIGDIKAARTLLQEGVNVNAKHDINGWTPLHWAAKRAHQDVVDLLLTHGADVSIHSKTSETPLTVCSHPDIRQMLVTKRGECSVSNHVQESHLPITPNYLRDPKFMESLHEITSQAVNKSIAEAKAQSMPQPCKEIVLKVRVANKNDPDFIEVEIPINDLTFSRLLRVCTEELEVNPSSVIRVRKLPNTIVRKDKDVARLKDGQELELVVQIEGTTRLVTCGNGMLKAIPASSNHDFQSASLNKNHTILY